MNQVLVNTKQLTLIKKYYFLFTSGNIFITFDQIVNKLISKKKLINTRV